MEKSKKGIVCILLSAFCFSLMSLFIRLAGDVPTMQKCFFRNLVAMLIAIAALVKAHQPFRIGKGKSEVSALSCHRWYVWIDL